MRFMLEYVGSATTEVFYGSSVLALSLSPVFYFSTATASFIYLWLWGIQQEIQ